MAEPGAELGIPTPPLAEDAQPAANASDAGDQAGRNKRRGRPRPRGGQRERERRQRQAQREQDPVHFLDYMVAGITHLQLPQTANAAATMTLKAMNYVRKRSSASAPAGDAQGRLTES